MGLEELRALFEQAPCGTPLLKSADVTLFKTKYGTIWWAEDWNTVVEELKLDGLSGWKPSDNTFREFSDLIQRGAYTLLFNSKVDEDLLWD